MMHEIPIGAIQGFKIGHAHNEQAATGCTVIICEQGASAGVDVRGGSPATRETELLRPTNTVEQIHAVVLSGGSAFGLEAADGVMKFLAERNIGFETGFARVPIVCGCSLYDLELVTNAVYPDKDMGYAACLNAYNSGETFGANTNPAEGNVGAGCGATVGKYRGPGRMMKSGLGIYAAQVGAIQVGAIVAVNALGDIIDFETREIIAGLLTPDGRAFADTVCELYADIDTDRNLWAGNTTIACVITNAKLDKTRCNKIATVAHNGYALTIRPVHSSADGDTVFVMSTCEVEAAADAVGILATECVARAINRAARTAQPAYGLRSATDFAGR